MKRLVCLLPLLLLAACSSAPAPVSVPTGGGSLFVDDGGRGLGLPVLFVHGNGGSSEQWRAQLDHLHRSGHRALALDLPGFGRSTAPANGDYSLEAMAAAVDHAVQAIGLRRFVLVGHSYGGAVVATYAAAHPEKVAGVIYVDSAATALPLNAQQSEQLSAAFRADKMKVVRAWFAPMLQASPAAVREQVFASVEATPTDAFLGALMSLTSYDAKRLVGMYTGPRLAIAATDIETPMAFQKQFLEIEAVPISGAGHWLMLDKPGDVSAAIDRFLTSLP